MARKISLFFVLSLVMVGLLAVSVSAKNRIADPRLEKMSQYSFLYKKAAADFRETNLDRFSNRGGAPASLGTAGGTSPGALVGTSYYDAQSNSSMGRLIDWRGSGQIHMAWMFGPNNDIAAQRTVAYNIYDAVSGVWPKGIGVGCPLVAPSTTRAGFTNLDVRPVDGVDPDELVGGVVVAHVALGTTASFPNRTHVFYDYPTASLGYCDWSNNKRVPDALNDANSGDDLIWPKLEYQIMGSDTVTLALSYGGGDPTDNIVLFRLVGGYSQVAANSWTAQIIDENFYPLQDITASRVSGKVACVYTWPSAGTSTDPESNERDVVYKESTDMGVTFGPRTNITNYDDLEPGYRAWLEVNCLYDTNDDLHIIYNASVFTPGEGAGGRACRLFHWSDATSSTGVISTVYNGEWDPLLADCVMGFNVMNVGKFSVSECNGRLYTIWSQANDPDNGLIDDCANEESASSTVGGNAEIYMSVSSDLQGLAWDAPRNLTNTYTPGCDTLPGGLDGDCDSDNWAAMSRYGMNNSDFGTLDFANASAALTVDPDPSYTDDWYLDVQYVDDLFPSAGPYDGTPDVLLPTPIKWFRLPCVDPVVQSSGNLTPGEVTYPFYLKHGTDTTFNVLVENSGNDDLTAVVSKVETTGPTGWLDFDKTSLNIPNSIGNTDVIAVTLNNGGIVNTPGTIVNLVGAIVIDIDEPTVKPQITFDLDFLVADTVVNTIWDTLSTGVVRLTVSSNGNMGDAGGDNGTVNLDFVGTLLDCDQDATTPGTDNDTIPGDASVYLYDASPVVLQTTFAGADTNVAASWAIFDDGFQSENGFKPIVDLDNDPGSFSGTGYEAFWSGLFVTADTNMTGEKTWYAPTGENFVVMRTAFWSTDGSSISDLTLGEAYDWDVPSDTGSQNVGGFDPIAGVVWLQGGEYTDPQGDSLECQDNDTRFGAAGLIGYTDAANTTLNTGDPAAFYTALNEDFVYPAGGFVPLELFRNMNLNSGYSTVASSTVDDQHMVMSVLAGYTLAAADTVAIYTVIAAVMDGSETDIKDAIAAGRTWFNDNPNLPTRPGGGGCCIGGAGNVNFDPGDAVDISDLTKLVNHLFVTFEALDCPGEANTNGDAGCAVDISDLTKLVNHLFVTFEALADCLPQCQ